MTSIRFQCNNNINDDDADDHVDDNSNNNLNNKNNVGMLELVKRHYSGKLEIEM